MLAGFLNKASACEGNWTVVARAAPPTKPVVYSPVPIIRQPGGPTSVFWRLASAMSVWCWCGEHGRATEPQDQDEVRVLNYSKLVVKNLLGDVKIRGETGAESFSKILPN